MPHDEKPWQDPIVAEVRAVREALYAESGYDIHEFCRRAQERQETSGHPIVRHAPPTRGGSKGEAV
jgi:hypothetical protein